MDPDGFCHAAHLFVPAIFLITAGFGGILGVSLCGTRLSGAHHRRAHERRSPTITPLAFRSVHLRPGRPQLPERAAVFSILTPPPLAVGRSTIIRTANILGYQYSTLADGWGDFINYYSSALCIGIMLIVIGLPSRHLPRLDRARPATAAASATGRSSSAPDPAPFPPGPQFKCVYTYTDLAGKDHTHRAGVSPLFAVRLTVGEIH